MIIISDVMSRRPCAVAKLSRGHAYSVRITTMYGSRAGDIFTHFNRFAARYKTGNIPCSRSFGSVTGGTLPGY